MHKQATRLFVSKRFFANKAIQYVKTIGNNPKTALAGLLSFFSVYAGFMLHKRLTDQANEEKLQREIAKYNIPQQRVAFHHAKKTIDSSLEIVKMYMQQKGIPGLSVCVMVDDQLLWSEGFGHADVEQQVLVRPAQTVFPINGALASLFRTAVLMPLKNVAQEKVVTYLPDYGNAEATVEQEADKLSADQLQQVITKATSTPFSKIVQSKLLDSLRLKQTYLQQGATMIPYRARGYHRTPELENTTESIHGKGAFCVSAEDLCSFAQATLLDISVVNDAAQRKSGKSKKLDAISTNYVIVSESEQGTSTSLVVVPGKQTIVAVQANLDNVDVAPVAAELAALFSVHHRKAIASIKKWFS